MAIIFRIRIPPKSDPKNDSPKPLNLLINHHPLHQHLIEWDCFLINFTIILHPKSPVPILAKTNRPDFLARWNYHHLLDYPKHPVIVHYHPIKQPQWLPALSRHYPLYSAHSGTLLPLLITFAAKPPASVLSKRKIHLSILP